MANLIITVISIALVSVAALMGAYYGGSAFMQGQAKAKANSLSQAFQQTAAAVTMYRIQTGNDLVTLAPNPLYGWSGFEQALIPAYLSATPFKDNMFSSFNINDFLLLRAGNGINPNSGGGYMMSFAIGTDETTDGGREVRELCKHIVERARGPGAEPVWTYGNYTVTDFGKFDCGWYGPYLQQDSTFTFSQCEGGDDYYCQFIIGYRI